jgi:ribulose-bisphosphate carboxylase large chain
MRVSPVADPPTALANCLRVTYDLACPTRGDAEAKARDIAREQTVEVPEGTAPEVEARLVGQVESIAEQDSGRWRAVIAYAPDLIGSDVTELFNLLFGNVSLKPAVRVVDVEFPAVLRSSLPGPRFGIAGIRETCGAAKRPLFCTAAKPVGLDEDTLATQCYRFARAGADIVKDDHNVADQLPARFADRVRRCQEAVERANAETGGRTLYFPHVSGPIDELSARLDLVQEVGCRGVLVNLLPQGVDAARSIGARGLIVLAHPTMTGVFFGPDHGIAPDVLLGTLFRIAGADGVIYVNAGGRFTSWTIAQCQAINERLRAPMGPIRPAFPVPGGGVDAERVPYWIEQYGADTMFLIGASLLRQPDVEAATRWVVETLQRVGA